MPPGPEQGLKSGGGVGGFQPDDKIHIAGQTDLTVRIHGEPADDEVLHPGVVQGPDDGFNAADFHRLHPALRAAVLNSKTERRRLQQGLFL